jgi:hypothetical protein
MDLPLKIAVVGIDGNERTVHQDRELLEARDIDQNRRRVGVREIIAAPRHAAVRLLEGHQGLAPAADGHDDRVAKRDRARRVAVHQSRSVMVGPQLLRPQQLAARLRETLQPAGHAGREHAITDDERRRVGAVAHLGAGVAQKRHVGRVFPDGGPAVGVGGEHDFLARLAVHRVQHGAFDGRRGVALADRAFPDHAGARVPARCP